MTTGDRPLTRRDHIRIGDQPPHRKGPRYQTTDTALTLSGGGLGEHRQLLVTDTSSARTITLASTMAREGQMITVVDASGAAATNNITIATEGSETINGAATYVVLANYEAVTIISDGTNYFVMGGYLE